MTYKKTIKVKLFLKEYNRIIELGKKLELNEESIMLKCIFHGYNKILDEYNQLKQKIEEI